MSEHRPLEQYVALCRTVFPGPNAALKQGYLPSPHSVCIIQAAKPGEPGGWISNP
jgi:hypothetical protein